MLRFGHRDAKERWRPYRALSLEPHTGTVAIPTCNGYRSRPNLELTHMHARSRGRMLRPALPHIRSKFSTYSVSTLANSHAFRIVASLTSCKTYRCMVSVAGLQLQTPTLRSRKLAQVGRLPLAPPTVARHGYLRRNVAVQQVVLDAHVEELLCVLGQKHETEVGWDAHRPFVRKPGGWW